MITTDNALPDWIAKQATLGQKVSLEVEQAEENALRYLLSVCCPQIFESYAIVLGPFWINWKVKELVSSGLILTETDESDFKRLSWRQFFNLYDKDFEINTAHQIATEIDKQLTGNWPPYLWFPGEGNCETEELNFILNQIADRYGDTIVNYYYCLLKTQKWEGDIFYRALISEVDTLKDKTDIRDNPTAIYPDNKDWCIVSDYDLPYTYIGGTKELIDSIASNSAFDIYKIEPLT
ncbi:MAG: hypothetical protein IT269_05620 [Saprospiraceae bacterium]|nr:hypothetical protein [Saprospiraceae bacterium]